MAIKARGETLDVNDQVNLTITFKDGYSPVNTDIFPQISIIQPSGNVLLAPTSTGVSHIGVGMYLYTFTIPFNGPYGVYSDVWTGLINGNIVEAQFQFVVVKTDVPSIASDGYHHLGELVPLTYSQIEIQNINKLLRLLKARLNSSGKSKAVDAYGNTVYVDCDIFSIDTLVSFLATAISDFNQVPYFTNFKFDDDSFTSQFAEILVEGATLYALSSKALIEKGAEFTVTDNSINFAPPSVSDLLQTQYSTLLTHYFDKLKIIKNSMRPAILGLGTFSMTSGSLNPAYRRLRHLRERRII